MLNIDIRKACVAVNWGFLKLVDFASFGFSCVLCEFDYGMSEYPLDFLSNVDGELMAFSN